MAFFKEMNRSLIATKPIKIIVEANMFKTATSDESKQILSQDYGQTVKSIYIFKILDEKKLYNVFMPIISTFTYQEKQNIMIRGRQSYCFSLVEGDVLLDDTLNTKNLDDLDIFLNKFINGKFQNIPYDKQLYTLKMAFFLNSSKDIGVEDAVAESQIRYINRNANDLGQPYSQIVAKDPFEKQREMMGMKNIIPLVANSMSDTGFENINASLPVIFNSSKKGRITPMEKTDEILAGIY